MGFLLTILFTLLFTLVAGSIVGACFRSLPWRLMIWAAFPPCIVPGIILASVGPDALLNASASQGGAMLLFFLGFTPLYYGVCGMGIVLGHFLRKHKASNPESSEGA
jgi:hypothetical protein